MRSKGTPCEMKEGRDVYYDEILAAADPELPGRADGRRAPALHPLHLRLDGQAEGHPAHDRRLPDGRRGDPPLRLRPASRSPTSTGARPTSAGSPATPTSSTGRSCNGATSVMYEGAPDYPHKGIWWELVERYGVTHPLPRPDRDPRLHQVGRASGPSEHDLSSAAPARLGRRADQPEGLALVPQGDRRRALPDRRHVVADRDRRDHDHAAAGHHRAPSPARRRSPFPGVDAEVVDESTASPSSEGQGLLVLTRPWPSMLRTLYKEDERFVETYFKRFGRETYLVGDAARRDADGYIWVIGRIDDVVNVSGHRLSTAEVESAIVAHPDVAEAAVIGQHDEDTGQAIVAFVTLQGELEGDDEHGRGHPRDRRRADRQVRPPEAHHLGGRPAEDALRQDHAPPAARHRRGPRARRRHDAARPGGDGAAGGAGSQELQAQED